jgi:hypothetical protein
MFKIAYFNQKPEYIGDCTLLEFYNWFRERQKEGLTHMFPVEIWDGEKFMFLCDCEQSVDIIKNNIEEVKEIVDNSAEPNNDFADKLNLILTAYYG